MSALPQGYDAWKTAMPDEVYCTHCSRAVAAAGHRKQEHDFNCPEHPTMPERRRKAAASAVRVALKAALREHEPNIRLEYVWNDHSPQPVYRGDEQAGLCVSVDIFVSQKEIGEWL